MSISKLYELKEPIIIDTDDYTIEQINLIKQILIPLTDDNKEVTIIKIHKGAKIEYA